MQVRQLAVRDTYAITPKVFRDDRGLVVSHYREEPFAAATGRPLFPVAHASHSESCRGTVRGIHFTATPPGTAKYVYCPRGRTLDLVVDLRVGSPTFGAWDSVVIDPVAFEALYLPVGVGHACVALEDDTIVTYMWSGDYVAEQEMAIDVFDPAIGLPIPSDVEPLLSGRDRDAPTLAQAEARGLLPRYEECQKLDEALATAWRRPAGR